MQLELFRTRREAPKKAPAWERLGKNARATVIRTFARVMAKTVMPAAERHGHER